MAMKKYGDYNLLPLGAYLRHPRRKCLGSLQMVVQEGAETCLGNINAIIAEIRKRIPAQIRA